MFKGIDISDNQGTISWGKVKAAGVQFSIIRTIRGSGKVDYKFLNNIDGCRTNGIPFDVYKYSYADTMTKAKEEATLVVNLLRNNKIDCIVWWDMEDASLKNLGKPLLTKLINTAKEVVEDAGLQFGVYCNQDWYRNVLDTTSIDCPFWIARYPSNDNMEIAENPNIKYRPSASQKLFGWQYTSKGKVPGITGNVDLNVWYEDAAAQKPSVKPINPYKESADLLKYSKAQAPVVKESVKWLQWELTQAGYPLTIDGKFGAKTELALKAFQESKKIIVDGKCGPITRKMLKI